MEAKGSTCPICFEFLKGKTVGSPDNCDHEFCLPCLQKWSKHGNFCPVDRQKFTKIVSGDEIIRIKPKRKKRNLELYDISVVCDICKDSKENDDTVILCDCCDLAFHFDCLQPPLKHVPHGQWHCPDCREVSRKLKAKKTQNKVQIPNKASVHSLPNLSKRHQYLNLPTNSLRKVNRFNNNKDQSRSIKFTETKHNHVKLLDDSEKDYYQKNFFSSKSVDAPMSSSITPSGEFEDFFSICDDDIILTNRKPLTTEATNFNKSTGKEFRPLSSRVFRKKACGILKPQEADRKTKRLAAAIARKKINQNLNKESPEYFEDNSSSSSWQSSVAETDSLGNASSDVDNCPADLIKTPPSSSFILNNKNAMLYISQSKLKPLNVMNLESSKEKNPQVKNLIDPINVSSKSTVVCEHLCAFNSTNCPDSVEENLNRSDVLNVGCKASFTNTKINNFMTENIDNSQIHTISEPLSTFEKPDHILLNNNCSKKGTEIEAWRTDANVDFQSGRKLRARMTEMRTKRLAAAIARKKFAQNFQNFNVDSSSSSESLDHYNSNDAVSNSSRNDSNPKFATNVKKVLLHSRFTSLLNTWKDKNPAKASLSSKSMEGIEMGDIDKSFISNSSSVFENPQTSIIAKVSHSVTEDLNSIESPRVFENHHHLQQSSSAKNKTNNSMAEGLNSVQINMEPESFSVSEKPTDEESSENRGESLPPELLLEPLNIIENHRNQEPKTEPSIEEFNDAENESPPEIFSVFEKISHTSGVVQRHSSLKMTNSVETCSENRVCQNEENSKYYVSSQEKNDFPVVEIDADEDIVNNFHIRQVRYAIKAKINLPAELQKIEQETWLTRRSKSSRKYVHKKSYKEANVHVSSSLRHQIVSGNEQLYDYFKNNGFHYNSNHITNLTESNNKFNPFCQSVSSSCPKIVKITEYTLQPSDKKGSLSKIPNDDLRKVMDPYSLKYLDIRDDGSLFLNWSKSEFV